MNEILAPPPPGIVLPAIITETHPKAAGRFADFFLSAISNPNTQKAYIRAVGAFLTWCEAHGLPSLVAVQPAHVGLYLKELQDEGLSKPTVKQALAAIRMCFDYLVVGQVMPTNPAHAVRGPKHSVKRGKTPVLSGEQAREILDAIPADTLAGRRDRALIGVMVFTFARVGAVITLKVEDYFQNGRRMWLRLKEKGGKIHEVPVHHKLEIYLDDYIAAAGIAGAGKTPLFRTVVAATDRLSDRPLDQSATFRMIGRRAPDMRVSAAIGCHTFRATGITAYLENGGVLEHAQAIAGHESLRTTQLYDRRGDTVSLSEIEKIAI